MRRKSLFFLAAANLVILPLLYWLGHPVLVHRTRPQGPGLPVYGRMPAFELTRESGAPFGNKEMEKNIWVADFIFTRCPNQCPMMSVKFGALQNSLPAGVRLASFSVDPEYDTPEKLSTYAQNYKADASRWVFLTGPNQTMRNIRKDLHLGTENDPGMHSLRFVLLDKQRRVRGYYDSGDTESLGKMRSDIESLRKEQ